MKLTITRWPSLTATTGERAEVGLDALMYAEPIIAARKEDLPGWSAATFAGDARKKAACETVTAVVFDYDDGATTFEAARALWVHELGLVCGMYETYSSTAAHHRFRVVIPLARPVAAKDYPRVWQWLRDRAAQAGHALDEGTKDCSRLWFVPGAPSKVAASIMSAEAFMFHGNMRVFDPAIALEQPAEPKPSRQAKRASARAAAKQASTGGDRSAYYAKALASACDAVASAPPGGRNSTLNREAYSLAGYVAAGHLSRERAYEALWDAAVIASLPESEIRKTLDSAFAAGEARPHEAPARARPAFDSATETPFGDPVEPAQPATTAGGPASDDADEWRASLRWATRKDGTRYLLATTTNAALVMAHAPEWAGVLGWDEFGMCVVKRRAPPYTRALARIATLGDWCDDDDQLAVAALEASEWRLRIAPKQVYAAARLAAKLHPFHPVRDYLAAARHDGVERLGRWMVDYLGAPDTAHVKRVGRWFLLALVARVMEPGCKQDSVFTLEGDQGINKSSVLAALCGPYRAWFTDSPVDFRTKDGFLAIRRKWIVEIAEIDKISAAERPRFKAFASSASDWYREPYARSNVDVPRQCVCIGTTNADAYLADATGARRDLPVRVGVKGPLRLDALRADAPQLWAEALAEYQAGGERRRWWPATVEEQRDAAEEAEDRYQQHPWAPLVAAWLTDGDGRDFERVTTTAVLVHALGFKPQDLRDGHRHSIDVGAIMRRLGWTVSRPRTDNPSRDRYYVRPRPADPRKPPDAASGPDGPDGPGGQVAAERAIPDGRGAPDACPETPPDNALSTQSLPYGPSGPSGPENESSEVGDETSRSVASLNNPVVDYPRAPWEPQDDAPSAPASRARAHTTVGESAANDAPAPPVSAEDEAWLWGAE